MGYPVTIFCYQSVRNLLKYGKYTLTMSRPRDYQRPLEQEVILVRCATANSAEKSAARPHGCIQEAERYSKLRSDLRALQLQDTEVE